MDLVDRCGARVDVDRGAVRQRIAVGRREGGEAAAEFVGAVAA
jgi:hypothetical protein